MMSSFFPKGIAIVIEKKWQINHLAKQFLLFIRYDNRNDDNYVSSISKAFSLHLGVSMSCSPQKNHFESDS
jgi:hypothetical protein